MLTCFMARSYFQYCFSLCKSITKASARQLTYRSTSTSQPFYLMLLHLWGTRYDMYRWCKPIAENNRMMILIDIEQKSDKTKTQKREKLYPYKTVVSFITCQYANSKRSLREERCNNAVHGDHFLGNVRKYLPSSGARYGHIVRQFVCCWLSKSRSAIQNELLNCT